MPARYLILLFIICIVSCHDAPMYPIGGYPYPKHITDKDTNSYTIQLNDSMTPRQLFWDHYSYIFYQAFNEPNLSIKPQPKETFRFIYSEVFGHSIIITFNEDSLTVKEGNPNGQYDQDTTRLSAIENLHLSILNRRFPIYTDGKIPAVKKYWDSMINLYPQLLDAAYYHKLYNKHLVRTNEQFSPKVKTVALSKQQYTALVDEINASGFWMMPWKIKCTMPTTDGYGFHLEVNTKTKYKIVEAIGCPNDSTKFTKACQKIIDCARLDKKLNLIWDGSVDTITVLDIPLEPIKQK